MERQALRDEPLGDRPPYGGASGGAVGGTPAQKRATGGRTGRGIDPGGSHRGDSTIGGSPDEPSE